MESVEITNFVVFPTLAAFKNEFILDRLILLDLDEKEILLEFKNEYQKYFIKWDLI